MLKRERRTATFHNDTTVERPRRLTQKHERGIFGEHDGVIRKQQPQDEDQQNAINPRALWRFSLSSVPASICFVSSHVAYSRALPGNVPRKTGEA